MKDLEEIKAYLTITGFRLLILLPGKTEKTGIGLIRSLIPEHITNDTEKHTLIGWKIGQT